MDVYLAVTLMEKKIILSYINGKYEKKKLQKCEKEILNEILEIVIRICSESFLTYENRSHYLNTYCSHRHRLYVRVSRSNRSTKKIKGAIYVSIKNIA